jgi:hypothetical protein
LLFEASKVVFDNATSTATLTVCGVKLTISAGTSSRLISLSGGGIGVEPARRRSIATNTTLALAFDSEISVANVRLSGVGGTDAGRIELADSASTKVNFTSDTVDTSAAGKTQSLSILATDGDGFEFVSVDASREVPSESTTTTTSGTESATEDNLLPPAGEMMWGPLVWWIWIAIICGVLVCIAVIVIIVYCVAKRRGDDDDDDADAGWDMGGSARHGHASERGVVSDSPEMTSARAFVDDEDDPNLAFRAKRLSLTPAAAASLTAPSGTFGRTTAELGRPTGGLPPPAAYSGNSFTAPPPPTFKPPPSSGGSVSDYMPSSSIRSPVASDVHDQYQSLPVNQ